MDAGSFKVHNVNNNFDDEEGSDGKSPHPSLWRELWSSFESPFPIDDPSNCNQGLFTKPIHPVFGLQEAETFQVLESHHESSLKTSM